MGKRLHRKRLDRPRGGKAGNKNKNPPYPLSITAIESRIERLQAMLTARKAAEQGVEPEEVEDSPPERDEAENHVVVKFFWKQLVLPTDREIWKSQHGRVGSARAPEPAGTVPVVVPTFARKPAPPHGVGEVVTSAQIESGARRAMPQPRQVKPPSFSRVLCV
jgi:hypothetical protein